MTELSPLGDQPLVTIVTPSFNQGQFISETIESVLSQDYPRIEYLVVDGESTDETLSILRRYEDRVNWVSEPDRNQSQALNKGFRRAKGSIVAWINSDDLLLPGAVSTVVQSFIAEPSLGLVYGATRLIDRDGRLIEDQNSRPPDAWMMVFLADFVAQPSAFMRREVLAQVGEIDESLRYCMDYELFIRFFAESKVRQIPEFLSATRIHGETFTASGGSARFREVVRVVRFHSGRRVPPAVLFYAIDWFELAVRRHAHRLRSTPFAPLLRKVGDRVSEAAYGLVARALSIIGHSIWDDGWKAKRSAFLVRAAEGNLVEIVGEIYGRDAADLDQVLEVTADGAILDRVSIPPGHFRLVYQLPRGPTREGLGQSGRHRAIEHFITVKVKAKWAKRPSKLRAELRRDRRKLSWRLNSMELVGPHHTQQPIAIGWYDDGWAGPAVTVFVPPSTTELIVSGRLPEGLRPTVGQRLAIHINDRCVHEDWLQPGQFSYVINLPREVLGTPIALHLSARNWFIPGTDDVRRLSYILDVAGVSNPAIGATRV